MATHPGMVLAYDDAGNIINTLEVLVLHDEAGNAIGMVDFAGHEEAGGEMLDVWFVEEETRYADGRVEKKPARGSKVWPEYLGARAHEFRVELEGPAGRKRIAALVHRTSGHRRERAHVEAAIESRLAAKRAEAAARAAEIRAQQPRRDANGRFRALPEVVVEPEPADIRDLVGGPDRPITLDDDGRTASRRPVLQPALPLVGVRTPGVSAMQQTGRDGA